jgi:hypothetical protein
MTKMELVTGDKRDLLHGRKLSRGKMGKPRSCMMVHTENLVLVDKKRVRGFYDGTKKRIL